MTSDKEKFKELQRDYTRLLKKCDRYEAFLKDLAGNDYIGDIQKDTDTGFQWLLSWRSLTKNTAKELLNGKKRDADGDY